ncbi:probable cadmium/zinc-transporting ATPase HMA1, chloroplastic, partial [Humulus lupulus]|uniref:probable cadmium/zinc-transporting ATPase HMA1, chloroplastic n=1 Tax=Humulus lupulus TaxID=3486 RepID=UPI002B4165F9
INLLPKTVAKPLHNAFILVAFPLVGVSAALDALIDISGGKVNIHVLMALAAFASVFMGNALEGGLLLAMFNLAHIAEEYFTSRSMIDVKELKENHPESALVLDMNEDRLPNTTHLAYKRVPVHNIEVGSYVLVGAGESVPVDCEVFQGNATITIEHLTGEVKPLEIKVGDRIPGGARNLGGRIIVKATKMRKESTLSKIVQLTEEARLNKPKLQRWLDQFGEQYSKVVVVLSVAIALIGPFLFKWPFFGTSGKLAFKAIEPIYGHQAGNNNSNLTTCCIPNCEKEALAVAAAMEKGTTHPIGR